jgi:transcriptional regulator with XRE-family HTH domain
MRLYWNHLWRSRAYRRASRIERQLLEMRFSLAHALKSRRRKCGVSQCQLAELIGVAQSTVSRMERPLRRVSLDQIVFALCALGADDAEIAGAFNAGQRADVQKLRQRASLPFYSRPAETSRRSSRV